jgi:hypothetical protein
MVNYKISLLQRTSILIKKKSALRLQKEVYITPLAIRFGTEDPPNFKMGRLTPLTLQYQSIDPLSTIKVILLGCIARMDSGLSHVGA